FWNSVLRVLDVPPEQRERIPLGAAPPLEHAATPGEVAVAAATLLASGSGESRRALAAHNALLNYPAWRNVLRGRLIEARREDPGIPLDRTMGRLRDPALIGFAAQILDGDRLWSATQLNDLGQCPFRFFARRLLHLEELK